jgi:hypothetical protein
VGLVHHEEPDARGLDRRGEPGRREALGRDVEHAHVAAHGRGDRLVVRGRVLLGVDERHPARRALAQHLDLVLHERHERRDHEREVVAHERGKLVGQRLAGARGHHHEHVAVGERRPHGLLLAGRKASKPKCSRSARWGSSGVIEGGRP